MFRLSTGRDSACASSTVNLSSTSRRKSLAVLGRERLHVPMELTTSVMTPWIIILYIWRASSSTMGILAELIEHLLGIDVQVGDLQGSSNECTHCPCFTSPSIGTHSANRPETSSQSLHRPFVRSSLEYCSSRFTSIGTHEATSKAVVHSTHPSLCTLCSFLLWSISLCRVPWNNSSLRLRLVGYGAILYRSSHHLWIWERCWIDLEQYYHSKTLQTSAHVMNIHFPPLVLINARWWKEAPGDDWKHYEDSSGGRHSSNSWSRMEWG